MIGRKYNVCLFWEIWVFAHILQNEAMMSVCGGVPKKSAHKTLDFGDVSIFQLQQINFYSWMEMIVNSYNMVK